MAGQSSAMFGRSWTEVSVFGSQVFGQALMESCELARSLLTDDLHLSGTDEPNHSTS